MYSVFFDAFITKTAYLDEFYKNMMVIYIYCKKKICRNLFNTTMLISLKLLFAFQYFFVLYIYTTYMKLQILFVYKNIL